MCFLRHFSLSPCNRHRHNFIVNCSADSRDREREEGRFAMQNVAHTLLHACTHTTCWWILWSEAKLSELSFHLQCRSICRALKTCTENNTTKFMVSTRQKKMKAARPCVCVCVCTSKMSSVFCSMLSNLLIHTNFSRLKRIGCFSPPASCCASRANECHDAIRV